MKCNAWQIQGKHLALDFDGITDPEKPVIHVGFMMAEQTVTTRAELVTLLRSIESDVADLISDALYVPSTELANSWLVAMLPDGEAAHG